MPYIFRIRGANAVASVNKKRGLSGSQNLSCLAMAKVKVLQNLRQLNLVLDNQEPLSAHVNHRKYRYLIIPAN
jgi:hypothetical protein